MKMNTFEYGNYEEDMERAVHLRDNEVCAL